MIQSYRNSYWLAQKRFMKTFCNMTKRGIKMILNVRLTGQHNRLGLEVACRKRSLLNTEQTYKRKGDHIFSFWLLKRPLALRGHVTNASLKQRVVILLLPKIDRTHKNCYTRNLRGIALKEDILWFDFSTKSHDLNRPPCWRAYSCPPTWWPNYFLLISC